MATTIQFFNVFLKNNRGYTSISVSDFLDGIISLDEGKRYVHNSHGEYSLIEMLLPNMNPNNNSMDRLVGFANYRDKKPFTGRRGTDEKKEIAGDVLELTTCLFIPDYHLAVIEYNHFGARPKHIERYLNAFLPTSGGWYFEMIPIETEGSFQKIRSSNDIRGIEIKLDLMTGLSNLFNSEGNKIQSITSAINSTAESFREIGANIATINLGQGRYRNSPMEFDELINFLQAIDMENDNIASVKVKYRNPTSGKLETADLKNEGQLKRVIMEDSNSTAFESIAIGISNYYYEQSNRLANQEWRHVTTSLQSEELPLIDRYSNGEESSRIE
ncbi:DUF6731 family protein [Metasolibacillus sp.]|uniref:DUF6731 family protein n=1 Tax=Metasolibacillus sp. TaxID=2703680 RepID=UPI0025D52EC5|nr:DUF6731 family protein [Metasolibacillus sp.]MCT6924506.1 hypothetical protein [Metasolibacillus sp.]MCT6940780.1 hypothetical protein [Metasolibacillus sp.]